MRDACLVTCRHVCIPRECSARLAVCVCATAVVCPRKSCRGVRASSEGTFQRIMAYKLACNSLKPSTSSCGIHVWVTRVWACMDVCE